MLNQSRLEALLDHWEQAIEGDPGVDIDDFVASVCVGEDSTLADDLRGKITKLQRMYSFVDNFESGTDGPADSPENQLRIETGAEPVPGYRLAKLIAQGGYGQVWEAVGPGGFVVALKFVRLAGRGVIEQDALEFAKQARHPNLIATHGAWNTAGYLIVAMERAEATLMERFEFFRERGEKGIPRAELIRHIADAAAGLDHLNLAHNGRPGIQHRDVKPQNLLLVGDRVKVADFGISKIVQDQDTGHTGAMTVGYAAPEFFQGRTTSQSDQYSLAITYCFLLTGQMPFTGSDAEVMAGHISGSPNLSKLTSHDQSIVSRALSKKPNARWDQCSAFADALQGPGTVLLSQTWLNRRSVVASVAMLCLILCFVIPFRMSDQGDTSDEEAVNRSLGSTGDAIIAEDIMKIGEQVAVMKSGIESYSSRIESNALKLKQSLQNDETSVLLREISRFLKFSLGNVDLDVGKRDIVLEIDHVRYEQFVETLSRTLSRDATDQGEVRIGVISPRSPGFAVLRYDLISSDLEKRISQAMVDATGCVLILGNRVVDADWGEDSETSVRKRRYGNQVVDCSWFAVSDEDAQPLQAAFRSLRDLSLDVVEDVRGTGGKAVFSIKPLAWSEGELKARGNFLPGGPCGALNSFVGTTGELNLNVARDRLEQGLKRGLRQEFPDLTERLMLVWPGFFEGATITERVVVAEVVSSPTTQRLAVKLPKIE